MEAIESRRAHQPETLSPQYKNGFGTTDCEDGPWPRGAVIYEGRGPPLLYGNPGQWKPGYRNRGAGSRNGYNYYQYNGPPTRPSGYRPGYRGRRKPGAYGGGHNPNGLYPRHGGLRAAWHGSMPHGLQHCGFHAHRWHSHMADDGFIDDTLLTDLSQFSLHDDSKWIGNESLYEPTHGESRLALQTRRLAQNCISTPHLAHSTGINVGRPNSVQTSVKPGTECVMSSSLSPATTSDASNPIDRFSALGDRSYDPDEASSPEPQDSLLQEPLNSSRSLKALRSPLDFLTLVWDIST